MNKPLLLILFIFCSCSLQSQTEKAEELRSNVVAIDTEDSNGFGFVTGETTNNNELIVVTALHVVKTALEDSLTIQFRFYDYHHVYKGKFIDAFPEEDLAVFEIEKPEGYIWEKNCLATAEVGENVGFIGRQGRWYYPYASTIGNIFEIYNGTISADLPSIMSGSSGAPLVTKNGIVGMILRKSGISIRAIKIQNIQELLGKYSYFFLLTDRTKISRAGRRETQAFEETKTKNTIEAYRKFITKYPLSEFRKTAEELMREIRLEEKEEDAWKRTKLKDDYNSYKDFWAEYPNSRFTEDAKRRMEELKNEGYSVEDRNSNVYPVFVMKDGKKWLGTNLKTELEGSSCYENKPSNCTIYGRLYTLEAAKDGCKALGLGWHLPTDDEWENLINQYGGFYDFESDEEFQDATSSYMQLMQNGSSGLDLLLGGYKTKTGREKFILLEEQGRYWSQSPKEMSLTYSFDFRSTKGQTTKGWNINSGMHSVRCVK